MNYTTEIREFVIRNFLFGDAAALQNDKSFLESGIVDSTGMLELIMFLEHNYGITVAPEEMIPENLDSVDRLVEFLKKRQVKVAA